MSESEKLAEEGTFQVAILDMPEWHKMAEKDGDDCRMSLRLTGYVNGGPQDGKYISHDLQFTRTIITSGVNSGMSMFELSAETCHKLGMSRPFNPANIGELQGATCEFVTEWDEYKGKSRLRVRFINTGQATLKPEEAASIWAQLSGGDEVKVGASASTQAPLGGSEDELFDENDNVPF